MGLFSIFGRFDRPGPGVAPDKPRKKGAARWLEIVSRDAGSFVLAGVLALVGLLPYLLGLYLSIVHHAILMLLVTCLLGGLIAGPCCYGLIYTLLRSLRDNTSFWWYNWGKAVKRGWKDSLLPSVLCTAVYGMQIFVLVHLVSDTFTLGELLLLVVGVVLFTGIAVWMWPLAVLLDLPFPSILMDSVLLFFSQLPRTLPAIGFITVYFAGIVMLVPISLLVLPFLNLWFPLFSALLAIYKPLEKSFNIEESIRNLGE